MQGKIADMYTIMNASKAYVYTIANTSDKGDATRKDEAGVILFTTEKATWMALESIQYIRAIGSTKQLPASKLLKDAKLYEISPGTSEIRR